jgi:hypothetical protein
MQTLVPPALPPSTLYKEQAKRDATRIKTYNSVLNQIYGKIKAVSRVPENDRTLLYLVPEFIPGTPRIDVADCVIYLVWNLRNVGYKVTYTHPNLLYISWKEHDMVYQTKESPYAIVLESARIAAIEASKRAPTVSSARSTAAPKAPIIKKSTNSYAAMSLVTPASIPSVTDTFIRPGSESVITHTAPMATLSAKSVSFV